MIAQLPVWDRPHFEKPGGKPFLFYVIFGGFGELRPMSGEYRSAGVPDAFDLMHYGASRHPEVVSQFREGYLWDQLMLQNRALADQIAKCDECLILKGEREDSIDLNYLRDCVGLITFLLDHGGTSVYDPQMFHWWAPEVWRERIFQPASPVPRHHVVILVSEELEPTLTWFHTRGMRKFGRPDISVHDVPVQSHDAVIDLCNRFIELQAFGGIIPEAQVITMKSLPAGMTCHHGGDMDDPEFNNVHVEIRWP